MNWKDIFKPTKLKLIFTLLIIPIIFFGASCLLMGGGVCTFFGFSFFMITMPIVLFLGNIIGAWVFLLLFIPLLLLYN